jgi:hypothetical protein
LRWIAAIALKLVALGCLYWMLTFGGNLATAWGFILSTAAGVYLLFVPIIVRTRARETYRKQVNAFEEWLVSISTCGVAWENESGKRDVPWQCILEVTMNCEGMMFWDTGRTPLLWFSADKLDIIRNDVEMLLADHSVKMRHLS